MPAFGSLEKPVSVDHYQEIVEVGWSGIKYLAVQIGFQAERDREGGGFCDPPDESYDTGPDVPANYTNTFLLESKYKSIEPSGAWWLKKTFPEPTEAEPNPDPEYTWQSIDPGEFSGLPAAWNDGADVVNSLGGFAHRSFGNASLNSNPAWIRYKGGTADFGDADDIPQVPTDPILSFNETAAPLYIETAAEPVDSAFFCVAVLHDPGSGQSYNKTFVVGSFDSLANYLVDLPEITYKGKSYNPYLRHLIEFLAGDGTNIPRSAVVLYRRGTPEDWEKEDGTA